MIAIPEFELLQSNPLGFTCIVVFLTEHPTVLHQEKWLHYQKQQRVNLIQVLQEQLDICAEGADYSTGLIQFHSKQDFDQFLSWCALINTDSA